MSKKKVFSLVFLSVILSLGLNVLFGRYIAAKISTWPLLNRMKILSPQAPIVMTSREVVRVSETGDILKVVGDTKPKLSTVFAKDTLRMSVLGGAVNLASEGVFVTTKSVIGSAPVAQLVVKLNDGSVAPVTAVVPDPASSLVILRTDIKNISVATFADSRKLQVGEKLLFLSDSATDFNANFVQTSVYSSQLEIFNKLFQSDFPDRSFGAQAAGELIPGQAIVNLDGEVVGIWDGKKIIASDVIRHLSGLYLADGKNIVRPSFGFLYRMITPVESKVLGLPQGARIEDGPNQEQSTAGPAQRAGLRDNDIITAVNDTKMHGDLMLEEVLQRFKPGGVVHFTVARGNETVTLNLTVGELK